jgi:HTH-type transcriptional regulator / antitoxin HigA
MDVKPIRTAEDHRLALAEIERLWNRAKSGTPAGDRFEILSTLVDAYERVHFPVPPPDPVEAIRFRMEQAGLTTKDLLPVFKTTARASEIVNRKRRLNLRMIRDLHRRFAIPLECLVADYGLNKPRRRRSA